MVDKTMANLIMSVKSSGLVLTEDTKEALEKRLQIAEMESKFERGGYEGDKTLLSALVFEIKVREKQESSPELHQLLHELENRNGETRRSMRGLGPGPHGE
jgi:hypothetical protein